MLWLFEYKLRQGKKGYKLNVRYGQASSNIFYDKDTYRSNATSRHFLTIISRKTTYSAEEYLWSSSYVVENERKMARRTWIMPRSDKAAFLWSRAMLGAALPCVPIETRGVDSEGMAWLKDIGSRTKYVPRKQTRRRDRIKANLSAYRLQTHRDLSCIFDCLC